jgi:lipoprotein NlpD
VIVAASDGSVVYSGSGLIGYGQLIIVKHNKRYLSAYAHNNKILVKEGDTVKGGQRIAEMGRSGSIRAMLHFEIRRDGKPIDPMRYLPK